MSLTEDEDMDEEPLDDLDDEEEEAEEEVDELSVSEASDAAQGKRKAKEKRKREIMIANRALRIKMGKSGAQAASRRSIKKGKDACQRKLWNIDVSKIIHTQFGYAQFNLNLV